MSCSSNSSIAECVGSRSTFRRRRAVLALLAGVPVLGLPKLARAAVGPVVGLMRWGRGEFRRFGFLVYEATLWAGEDPQRLPLALRLDYKRNIAGTDIVEASVKEMRRFNDDEGQLQNWAAQMESIFPDIKAGDHLVGVHQPDGAHFYQNERLLGVIDAPGFADAFFAIWLDPRTSAPELRLALLRRAGA